jgi:integrase
MCFIETVSLEELGEMAMNTIVENSTPTTVKGTVQRGRLPNDAYRTRESLTEREVERLMKAASQSRYGHRNATMILLAYRHGLRASELCSLRWEQVDLVHGRLHVSRAKNGLPSVHPLTGTELRALRRLQREQGTAGATCSYPSAVRRWARSASGGSSSALARLPSCLSRSIRTWCGISNS